MSSTGATPAPSLTAERSRLVAFFAIAFGISWAGAFAVAAPHLLRHDEMQTTSGLMMFPLMLLGPSFAGIFMTWRAAGGEGLRDLRHRMGLVSVPAICYVALLVPPLLVWSVLAVLSRTVSPVFTPNHFWIGAAFGILAGFLEEIGWTGFALPRFLERRSVFTSGAMLGVIWGLWHLPVIDFLGTATPHRAAWLPFCLMFIAAMTGIRILIAYQYAAGKSVLLAQLLHMSSTGSLVVFSAPRVSGMQEAFWYAVYAVALWTICIGIAVRRWSRN